MNSTQTKNQSITKAQTANLIDALSFAELNHMRLTRFLSFNLEDIEMRPQIFVSRFLKRVADWLRSKNLPCTYIWVLEKPFGSPLNCHILLHLPDDVRIAFVRIQRRFAKLAGARCSKGFLESTKVGIKRGARNRPLTDGEHLVNVECALSYMLKGADRTICDLLGIDCKPQGTIRGKRVGTSQNIAIKARTAGGYLARPSERGALLFGKRHLLSLEPLQTLQEGILGSGVPSVRGKNERALR